MKNLIMAISALALASAIAVTPVKAQTIDLNIAELVVQCKTILLPEHCDRLGKIGAEAMITLSQTAIVIMTEGLEEANRQLGEFLDQVDKRPIPKKPGLDI